MIPKGVGIARFVPGEERDAEDIRKMEVTDKGPVGRNTKRTTHEERNRLTQELEEMIQNTRYP